MSLPDRPGANFVTRGIDDLNHDRLSIEALLVAIGSPHRPEHQLYTLLEDENERNAYSRYNALVRRLVSFERAMEFEQARLARQVNK